MKLVKGQLKVGQKVLYNGSNKEIKGTMGTIVASKSEPGDYFNHRLLNDEYVVDFGFESDCEFVVRKSNIKLVGDAQ